MSVAIVLCSGGFNSGVAATLARQRHQLVLLHAHKPGAPDPAGGAAFGRLADDLRPQRAQIVSLAMCPTPADALPDARRLGELLPLTGVAGRVAQQAGAAAIYVGLRAGPEKLAEALAFVQVWEELLRGPCGADVRVEAPLLELEPPQVRELTEQVDAAPAPA